MIKIIKDGNPSRELTTIYEIHCRNCGCIFECEVEDFEKLSRDINNPLAWITCPCCGQEIEVNRKTVIVSTREVIDE